MDTPQNLPSLPATQPEPAPSPGPNCAVSSGSAPKTSLLPFKLSIYDESQKAFPYCRQVGPFWIEIPIEEIAATIPPDFPGSHWEQVSRIEQYAKERIIADLECSFDVDAILPPLNTRSEPRP